MQTSLLKSDVAFSAGYRRLTVPYTPGERWMLEAAERQLGEKIEHVRVEGQNKNPELWRKYQS